MTEVMPGQVVVGITGAPKTGGMETRNRTALAKNLAGPSCSLPRTFRSNYHGVFRDDNTTGVDGAVPPLAWLPRWVINALGVVIRRRAISVSIRKYADGVRPGDPPCVT